MGATWRRGRGLVRADGYFDDGYGGRKLGVDASARLAVQAHVRARGAADRLSVARRRLRRTGRARPTTAAWCSARRRAGAGCSARACAFTCSPRTTSAPITGASSAAWPWSRWTRAYDDARTPIQRHCRRASGRRRRGRAGRRHERAVAADLPGRDDPARVRSRAARAAGRDVRELPSDGTDVDLGRRQPHPARGGLPHLPQDRSHAADQDRAAGARGCALRRLPRGLDGDRRAVRRTRPRSLRPSRRGSCWRVRTSSSTTSCTRCAASVARSAI